MTRKGTPQPIIDRLNGEIPSVVALPELRSRFAPLGIALQSGSRQSLDALAKSETRRRAEAIRKANVAIEQ